MRHILIMAFLGLILGLTACQGKKETMKNHAKDGMSMPAAEEKLVYYTCPMDSHKHIHSMEPGNCSECGMNMIKVVTTDAETAEFYGCPMESHGHVRSETPGKCGECGMALKPMKLKKT